MGCARGEFLSVAGKAFDVYGVEPNCDLATEAKRSAPVFAGLVEDAPWSGFDVAFFYRAPELKITFELMEGRKRTFRAVKPIIEWGVLVNKFVDSPNDVEAFFKGEVDRLRGAKSLTLHSAKRSEFVEDFEYVGAWVSVDRSVDGDVPARTFLK